MSVIEAGVSPQRETERAAPFPSVQLRSVKVHEVSVDDSLDVIKTAELDIVTAEPGVDDATEMLVRDSLPLSTITMGHPAVSEKSIFSIVTPVEDVVVDILKR